MTALDVKPYENILNAVLDSPKVLSLLPDSYIAKLLDTLYPDIAGPVVGEALCRHWLYSSGSVAGEADVFSIPGVERWAAHFKSKALPLVDQFEGDDLTLKRRLRVSDWSSEIERDAWDWLTWRICDYLTCDGLVPAVCGSGEAIPIPFRLKTSSKNGGVIDKAGEVIDGWNDSGRDALSASGASGSIQMLIYKHKACEDFRGASLGLPVIIAAARKNGRLGHFLPLQVLGTGDTRGGYLREVGEIEAKGILAKRLGVSLFVYPGNEAGENELSIPVGTPALSCIKLIDKELEARGLTVLSDVNLALKRLTELETAVHLGRITPQVAQSTVQRLEGYFEEQEKDDFALEGAFTCRKVLGSIANHTGDPQLGADLLAEAFKSASESRNPKLAMEALIHQVVSLTDNGLLDEAEAHGREALRYVKEDMHGDQRTKVTLEMQASGALGGQALLQKAFFQPDLRDASLQHLERALELAEQLKEKQEIHRDVVQVAQWYACFAPGEFSEAFESARAKLGAYSFDADGNGTSYGYLYRHRYFAAYRKAIENPEANREFNDWELPDERVGGGWVLELTRKYKGYLHALSGDASAAEECFSSYNEFIETSETPLFRFLGGTVALQAGESLQGHDGELSRRHLQRSVEVFGNFSDWFRGELHGSRWLERAEGLLAGKDPDNLPNPQLYYPY